MLTPQQKQHFETFGFLKLTAAFTAKEISEITRLFDEVMVEGRYGQPYDGMKRQMVLSIAERRPGLTSLFEDDRIFETMEDLLEPGFIWIAGDGNYYVGDTSWHSDQSEPIPGLTVVKMAFYLDPVRADSGCLRVVPGSHERPLRGVTKNLLTYREDPPVSVYGVAPDEVPCFAIESDPGDVLIFNQLVAHSSFGGSSGRRMFTMNFTNRPETPDHEAYHRRIYEGHLKLKREQGNEDTVYWPGFLEGGGPRRQSAVRQLLDWGFQ